MNLANWGLAFLFLYTVIAIKFSLKWERICSQEVPSQGGTQPTINANTI